MESTNYYDEAYAVSPLWLRWFDSLYPGDPRPSELPAVGSLRDSVIWYQDYVYRGFARSLLPLSGIDDCGTIVGKTSTIYYLGAEGFTGTVGSRPAVFRSVPKETSDIWSKCSWVVFKHRIEASEAGQSLHLKLRGDPPPGISWTSQTLWLR